jgi:hypothetical protein
MVQRAGSMSSCEIVGSDVAARKLVAVGEEGAADRKDGVTRRWL